MWAEMSGADGGVSPAFYREPAVGGRAVVGREWSPSFRRAPPSSQNADHKAVRLLYQDRPQQPPGALWIRLEEGGEGFDTRGTDKM
ncbi:unnamed protein product [Arctogadus glacialis]